MQKLRILCLHGYRQSGLIFKEKTGALRKALKKHVEFIYMTAPLKVPPLEGSDEADGGRGWWFSREDDFFQAKYKSDVIRGFEDSIQTIHEAIQDKGPIDGILGFSQGAAMLALLCLLQESGKLPFSIKFAIIFAGFKSQSTPHHSLYTNTVSIPTLHIIGETDQVIGQEMSTDLLKYFHIPMVLRHPGGHFVPASGPQKEIYLHFIERMKEVCSSESLL